MSGVGEALMKDGGRKILTGILIVALGYIFTLLVVGPRVVNPFDTSWIKGDPSQVHLAWLLLRQEDSLGLPLGWLHRLGYPFGEPLAYFDVLPLVTLALWPFRHVLPDQFQYLGPVFVINAVLQLYFGYRIVRRLNGDDRLAALAGGLIFMTAGPFVWRMLGHVAITSHWVMLAAIEFFLVARVAVTNRAMLAAAVLSFTVGCVNPYLALMVLVVVAGGYLRPLFAGDRLFERGKVIRSAIGFALAFAGAIAAMLLVGFLRLDDPSSYAGPGYGLYSMNLFSLVNPMSFGSILLPALPTGPGQYEGYNYLGLGVMAMAILALASRPSLLRRLFTREAIPAWTVIIVSLLLALSTTVMAGGTVILDLPVPRRLHDLLAIFRASGRLFWPAFYLIVTCVIAAALIAFGRRAIAIILACLVLQLADMRGLYAAIFRQWQASSSTVFTDKPAWQSAVRDRRHLVVLPAWQCDPFGSPAGVHSYWIFGKLAVEHDMTINSFFASRNSPRQDAFFCSGQQAAIMKDGLARDTTYVFKNVGMVVPIKLDGHFCRTQDGVVLCSADGEREGIDAALIDALPVTPLNEKIHLSSAKATGILAFGWSVAESFGRWSSSTEAALLLRTSGPGGLRIGFEMLAFLPAGRGQRVELLANGRPVANWSFDAADKRLLGAGDVELSVEIPSDLIGSDGLLILRFHLPDAVSPKAFRLSEDSRTLAVALKSVVVRKAEDR